VKNLIEKLAIWLDARSREILSAVIGAMAGIAAMLTAVMTAEPATVLYWVMGAVGMLVGVVAIAQAWCEGRGRAQ